MRPQMSPMDEAWWVDYIEEEGDPAWRGSRESLLSHSSTDREIVDNLRKIRGWVWSNDSLKSLEPSAPADWQEKQHEKIMKAISQTQIEPPRWGWQAFVHKKLFWLKPKGLRWWQSQDPNEWD